MHKIEKYLAHLNYQLIELTDTIQDLSSFPSKFNPDNRGDLHHLLFSILALTPTKYTNTGLPSTDKEALRDLLETSASEHTNATELLTALRTWNHVTTKRDFVRSYKDWSKDDRLHSNINITGTHWTRQSSTDPNQQNFDNSLDFLFGPPKGYYWLYLDLVNIELRIWAYEVGSKQLIEAFERGESVHMIIARAIRPHQIAKYASEDEWKAADSKHKQYTKTKGGTFARLYGGGVKKANATYGIDNALEIITSKIPGIGAYFKYLDKQAKTLGEIFGYPRLYTIQGYPLDIPIQKPYTTPSARIQGSASIIVQDMMRLITQSPIYNYGPQVHSLPLSLYTKRFSYHPISKHAPDFHYMHHPNPCSSANPYCHLIQQVHDMVKFEIPIHNNYETTNTLLLQELEAVGRLHIPTCPLDYKVIHYNDDPIKFPMYSYLPETIANHNLTYHYDNCWECQIEGPDGMEYYLGDSYEDVRQQAIESIETP
jgi:DNA polymerase I-like protein with 3'-5' exonuclease and polymerase domains